MSKAHILKVSLLLVTFSEVFFKVHSVSPNEFQDAAHRLQNHRVLRSDINLLMCHLIRSYVSSAVETAYLMKHLRIILCDSECVNTTCVKS